MFERDCQVMTYQLNESQEINSSIWIIGDSLLMEGIANCLDGQNIPNLFLMDQWDAGFMDIQEAFHPKLIIFDLDSPCSYALLELLRVQPGIHLLGIDESCDQVILLNSINRRTQTMNDLYQIIQEITKGGE